MLRPDSRALKVLLTVLVALGPLSTDIYLPALPTLVTDFRTDPATVQLTLSVFLWAFAVAQLAYGPLSDRFGRRPVLLCGLVLYVFGTLACMLAQTIDQLVAARALQAFGVCAGAVIGRAVVRDLFARQRAAQVLSYMTMAMALAPAVGPILGGLLVDWHGWRAPFVALAGIGVTTLVACMILLLETNLQRNASALEPRQLMRNYGSLLQSRAFLGYVAAAAGIFSGLFGFVSGGPFVLMDGLGLTAMQFGLCFSVFVTGYIIGSYAGGVLGPRFGLDRLILAGTLVAAVSATAGLIVALSDIVTVTAVLAPMFVYMVGAGLALPNAQAGGIAPFPEKAGAASALLGFLQMAVGACFGALIGAFQDKTQLAIMATICFTSTLAALLYRMLLGPERTLAAAKNTPV